MSNLIKPGLWTPNPADIGPAYTSLWRGLSYGFAFWGNGRQLYPFYRTDNFNNDQGAMPSAWTWEPRPSGLALDADGSGQLQIATSYTPANETTILWVGHCHTGSRLWGTLDEYEIRIDTTSGGVVESNIYQAGGAITQGTTDIRHTDHSVDHVVVCTAAYDAAGGPVGVWVDGLLEGSSSLADDLPASNQTLYFAGRTSNFFDGCTSLFVHWDRVLGDGEIRLLSQNPFGLIRPADPPTPTPFVYFDLTDMPSDFDTMDGATITTRVQGSDIDQSYISLRADSYVETADKAALDVTGDIEIIALLRHDNWGIGTESIVSKWETSGNQRSYQVYMQNVSGDTIFTLQWSTNGTDEIGATSAAGTFPFGWGDDDHLWIRWTLDVSVRSAKFFYSQTDGIDVDPADVTWIEDVERTGGSTSINAGTADFQIGANHNTSAEWTGDVYGVWVYDGIGGQEVLDADFRDLDQGWEFPPGEDSHFNTLSFIGNPHWFNNARKLYAQLFQSDEITPLSDEVRAALLENDGSWRNVSAQFTNVQAADKTTWDAARLRLRWDTV